MKMIQQMLRSVGYPQLEVENQNNERRHEL